MKTKETEELEREHELLFKDDIFVKKLKILPYIKHDINVYKETLEYLSTIYQKLLPDKIPNAFYTKIAFMPLRDYTLSLTGFPLYSKEWILPLAKLLRGKNCLEVMAGCGALSHFLKASGVDIKTTSLYTSNHVIKIRNIMPVEEKDACEAIIEYGESLEYLLMSWPGMTNICVDVLRTMREVAPNCILIYIGEPYGCTGTHEFHDTIHKLVDEVYIDISSKVKYWYGIDQGIYFCK